MLPFDGRRFPQQQPRSVSWQRIRARICVYHSISTRNLLMTLLLAIAIVVFTIRSQGLIWEEEEGAYEEEVDVNAWPWRALEWSSATRVGENTGSRWLVAGIPTIWYGLPILAQNNGCIHVHTYTRVQLMYHPLAMHNGEIRGAICILPLGISFPSSYANGYLHTTASTPNIMFILAYIILYHLPCFLTPESALEKQMTSTLVKSPTLYSLLIFSYAKR